jgi:hypothetical protein
LVLAGQDFKATTFNTALTHQLSTRVALKAGSVHESRVVLGDTQCGAEALRGAGHGLLRHGGRLVEFQGFYVEKGALIARCAQIGTPPATPEQPTLTNEQRAMVWWTVENLTDERGTAFTITALWRAGFGSQHAIRNLALEWERAGLIERELRGDAIKPQFWITPQLIELVQRENR